MERKKSAPVLLRVGMSNRRPSKTSDVEDEALLNLRSLGLTLPFWALKALVQHEVMEQMGFDGYAGEL